MVLALVVLGGCGINSDCNVSSLCSEVLSSVWANHAAWHTHHHMRIVEVTLE